MSGMTINSISNYGFLYGNYGFYNNKVQKSSGLMDFYNNLYANLGKNTGPGNSASSQSAFYIKDLGQYLKTAIDSLAGNNPGQNVFNQLTAVSSNSSQVTAVVDPKKAHADTLINSVYEIQVSQTAKAQENAGTSLKASDKALASGNYGFSIEIGGKTHSFNVSVSATDTNESIQQKMAAAINSKNIGVTAAVAGNKTDNTSKLTIAAANTGTNDIDVPVFKISDTTGNAASAMGITNVTQAAQNAVYSINGSADKTSKSNNVDLGNGVTASLLGAAAGTASLTFKPDGNAAVSAVKDLVKYLNDALTEASGAAGKRTSDLAGAISGMCKTYKPALQMVGINVSNNGFLSVDEKKLKAAADDGSLRKFFQTGNGINYGFTTRVQKIGGDMASGGYTAAAGGSSSNSRVSSQYFTSVYNKYSNYAFMLDIMV